MYNWACSSYFQMASSVLKLCTHDFTMEKKKNGSRTEFPKQEPCTYLRNYNSSFLLIKSHKIGSNLEIPNSQWPHPCLQPKQLFHGKRATAHAGMQTAGTPYWNLLPENSAINIWKNWSKCFYFYHTPSLLSYNVLRIKGIWQKTKKTENCELGSRITAQSLVWPSAWWYYFLYRILIQVLCCTVQIFSQEELLNGIIRQLLQEESLENEETNVSPCSSTSKTRSISKANILLSLQQVLSLQHRRYFLGMSHLTWDPTPAQGPAAINLWAATKHHKYPRGQGWDPEPRFLILEKESWKMVTNNTTFLQQHLLSALSHSQRKILRGTSKCPCPDQVHQELPPGQDTEQGSASSKAVGVLGLHPITLTALPHCFPPSHLLLVSYSEMAELLWSSPPPPLMLTQHLPAARDAVSRAGTQSVTVE